MNRYLRDFIVALLASAIAVAVMLRISKSRHEQSKTSDAHELTAEQIFKLRGECSKLAPADVNDVGAGVSEESFSHYDSDTSRCYIEQVEFDLVLDEHPISAYDKHWVPLSLVVYDAQSSVKLYETKAQDDKFSERDQGAVRKLMGQDADFSWH